METAVGLGCFATAIAGGGALLRRWRALRGTTLRAPLAWGMVALLLPGAVELWLGLLPRTPAWASHVRYLAAITTFCPLMAVLGAKRPQDRGWQFVVLTLCAVLAFPCAVALAYRGQAPLLLDPIWQWSLAVLLGMGLLNNLPTRYWPSALLSAAGQVLLLWDQLPLPGHALPDPGFRAVWPIAGVGALALAAAAWAWQWPRRRRPEPGIDRLWLDYRDTFGAVWSLRILARFNASAEMYGWSAQLQWHGLSGSPPDSDTEAAMRKSLTSLLRRFVPPDWIAQRLDGSLPPRDGQQQGQQKTDPAN